MSDRIDERIRDALASLAEPVDPDAVRRAAIARIGRHRRARRRQWFPVAAAALVVIVGGLAVVWRGLLPSNPSSPLVSPSAPPGATRTSSPDASTSPDADPVSSLAWTSADVEAAPDGRTSRISGIAASDLSFVAVGLDIDYSIDIAGGHAMWAAVWTSSDGQAWNRAQEAASFERATMSGIAAGPGAFVAVGSRGQPNRDPAIWLSVDGTRWESVALPSSVQQGSALSGIVWGGERFIAWGTRDDGRGILLGSPDGSEWDDLTAQEPSLSDARIGWIGPIESGLLAIGSAARVGATEPVLWRSADGASWRRLDTPADAFGQDLIGLGGIAETPAGLVAVGQVVDPLTPQDPGGSRAFSPSDGAAWMSPDVVTWVRVPRSERRMGGFGDQLVFGLVTLSDRLVAVGSTEGRAAVWSSRDGFDWWPSPAGAVGPGRMLAATVVGELVVAGGDRPSESDQGLPAIWLGRREEPGRPEWVHARSGPAEVGRAYPFELYTHCGLDRALIDFDGSFWDVFASAGDLAGNPPEAFDNPFDRGTVTLVSEDAAEFRSSGGVVVPLRRADDRREFVGCY